MQSFACRSAPSIPYGFHRGWLGGVAAVGLLVTSTTGRADLIISQYVETNSGTTPKAVEIWNSGAQAIDFATQNLQLYQGTNGSALTAIASTLINSGSLAANEVMVVGTSDVGTYLSGQGLGSVRFVTFAFSFNGDDALGLYLGGTLVDTFGQPGVDPGSSWSGGGVTTDNQNIALLSGVTTGQAAGWTNPSLRFATVSTAPAMLPSGLGGFGLAPVPVPEPDAFWVGGLSLALAGLGLGRRRGPATTA